MEGIGGDRIGDEKEGLLELERTAPPPLRCVPDRRLRCPSKNAVAPLSARSDRLTCSPTAVTPRP